MAVSEVVSVAILVRGMDVLVVVALVAVAMGVA